MEHGLGREPKNAGKVKPLRSLASGAKVALKWLSSDLRSPVVSCQDQDCPRMVSWPETCGFSPDAVEESLKSYGYWFKPRLLQIRSRTGLVWEVLKR